MKTIKKLLTIGLAFLLLFCMSVSLVGCAPIEEKEARSRIKNCFDIEVPKEAEMVYNYYQSWQESIGYTVFIFEQEPTDWLNESTFYKEKDEEFERKTKQAVDSYFEFSKNATPEDTKFLGSGLTVLPEEYLPDFEKEYWWKEHKRDNEFDIVALLYVPEKLMLVYFVKTW